MQTRKGGKWIGREHLVVVLPWGLSWFPSATGNKDLWP
jgi:hypothetical protein